MSRSMISATRTVSSNTDIVLRCLGANVNLRACGGDGKSSGGTGGDAVPAGLGLAGTHASLEDEAPPGSCAEFNTVGSGCASGLLWLLPDSGRGLVVRSMAGGFNGTAAAHAAKSRGTTADRAMLLLH